MCTTNATSIAAHGKPGEQLDAVLMKKFVLGSEERIENLKAIIRSQTGAMRMSQDRTAPLRDHGAFFSLQLQLQTYSCYILVSEIRNAARAD
jgi:hypothetical protein